MNERDLMEAEEREERIRDAAPDMLAALKTFVRLSDAMIKNPAMIWPRYETPMLTRARQIIAKAEGREL